MSLKPLRFSRKQTILGGLLVCASILGIAKWVGGNWDTAILPANPGSPAPPVQRQPHGARHTDAKPSTSAMNPADEISMVRGMAADEARNLLEQSKSRFPDLAERARYCAGVIKSLCLSGLSEEAWKLIDPNHGMVRRSQISQFFASADLDNHNLIGKMLEDSSERIHSFQGYLRRFRPSELKDTLQSPDLAPLYAAGLNQVEVGGAIQLSLMWAMREGSGNSPMECLSVAGDFHASGLLDTRGFFNLVNSQTVGDAFDKWTVLTAASKPAEGESDSKYRTAMVENMVRADAGRALDLLTSDAGSPVDSSSLTTAVKAWIREDSGSMDSWYAKHRSMLSGAQRDVIAEAHFTEALSFLEIEGAAAWIHEISDSGTKTRLLQTLGEARNHPK